MSIQAMKQALDDICGAKLCEVNSMSSRAEMIRLMDKAITALREAIEFAEMVKKGTKAWADTPDNWVDDLRGGAEKQEPVAFRNTETGDFCTGGFLRRDWAKWQPLYAAPREWVGLTDEDRSELLTQHHAWNEFGQAIEAKLREKNHG
jgi:hypothetical protein